MSRINDKCAWSEYVSVCDDTPVVAVIISHFNALSLSISPVHVTTGRVHAQSIHLQHVYTQPPSSLSLIHI